jgi:hypothetical protein
LDEQTRPCWSRPANGSPFIRTPSLSGSAALAGKDRHGGRDGEALGVEEATLVFPIETRRGDPRVRQPIERDVVEDLVTRQFAGGARWSVQSGGDRRGRLAVASLWSSSQAASPTGESATPYGVCGRAGIILAYSTCSDVLISCSCDVAVPDSACRPRSRVRARRSRLRSPWKPDLPFERGPWCIPTMGMEAVEDASVIVCEEVAVVVERDSNRRMPYLRLEVLRMGSGGDHQRA